MAQLIPIPEGTGPLIPGLGVGMASNTGAEETLTGYKHAEWEGIGKHGVELGGSVRSGLGL